MKGAPVKKLIRRKEGLGLMPARKVVGKVVHISDKIVHENDVLWPQLVSLQVPVERVGLVVACGVGHQRQVLAGGAGHTSAFRECHWPASSAITGNYSVPRRWP